MKATAENSYKGSTDKCYLFCRYPGSHNGTSGLLMVYLMSDYISYLESLMIDIQSRVEHLHFFKKLESNVTVYYADTSNLSSLETAAITIANFVRNQLGIHVSKTESRAKFRRKVKVWLKRLDGKDSSG